MGDWDRDEDGKAKIEPVLGYGYAISTDSPAIGVAVRFDHVASQADYLAGATKATQLMFSPDQAEEIGRVLIEAAQMARAGRT